MFTEETRKDPVLVNTSAHLVQATASEVSGRKVNVGVITVPSGYCAEQRVGK